MEKYNYFEAVAADVRAWCEENAEYSPMSVRTREDMEEYLNDTLWAEDSVTGNGSGSYTFDRAKAREYVLADLDTVKEAFEEFDEKARFADLFFSEDWETIDVITRCYCLGAAISEVVSTLPAGLFRDENSV